eukprot:scaffold539_cov359-Prasinococcus_capsulatus_cf.AAC.1
MWPRLQLTLKYKTFNTPEELYEYYNDLLNTSTLRQDFNEYEFDMVTALLKAGHHAAAEKQGGGVRKVQVALHPEHKSRCFMLTRKDGSTVDFSYRKAVSGLCELPAVKGRAAKTAKREDKSKDDTDKGKGGRGGRGGRGG